VSPARKGHIDGQQPGQGPPHGNLARTDHGWWQRPRRPGRAALHAASRRRTRL